MGLLSRIKTWVEGETLTASDLNAEFDNILNNLNPDSIEDASESVTQMQATADPYPGGSESLATSLRGELQRLRYLIKQITGKSQWYIDPSYSLENVRDVPSGEIILFEKDTAVTGYTLLIDKDDMVIYITKGSGAGGEAGATDKSGGIWQQPDHTLTIDEIPSHSHQIDLKGGKDSIAAWNPGDPLIAASNTSSKEEAGATLDILDTGGGQPHNHGDTWRPPGRNFTRQQRN